MRRNLLYVLSALAPLAASSARAQVPQPGPGIAATPRPVLCPVLSGLEIGQLRAAAYESMWCRRTEKPALGRDLTVLFTPREKRYTVTVTFDSEATDARVAALHYVFDPPPGLLTSIRAKYGPEASANGDPSLHVWDVPSCGVRIRYSVQLTEAKRPLREEVWIDRLQAKPEKPEKPEKAEKLEKAGRKPH